MTVRARPVARNASRRWGAFDGVSAATPEIIENEARIHQRHAVIGEEGRRFQERVEL
jgi:hypothetical protein